MSQRRSSGAVNDRYEDHAHISLSALDQYRREVEWVRVERPLTDEEEMQLLGCLERARGNVCPDGVEAGRVARDRLVEAYQPLVRAIAFRWLARLDGEVCFELLDLVQEGNIGLLKAIEEHEVTMGYTSLSGLAGRCIGHAIAEAVYQCSRVVRLPKDAYQVKRKVAVVTRSLSVSLGREPTFCEVACGVGLSEEKIREWLGWWDRAHVTSLHTLLEDEDASDRLQFESLYGESLEHDSAAGPVHEAIERTLTAAQRRVIELRYGLASETGYAHSQTEAAQVCGCTAQNIQKKEYRAKERLFRALAPVYGVELVEQIA